MQAEGQAIAGRVDRIHQRVQPCAGEADDVQHRPEHLPPQLRDVVDLDDRRRHEAAMRAFLRQWLLLHRAAQGAHRLYVPPDSFRSEEHTSELQSLMRISYAVFCLKKKTNNT